MSVSFAVSRITGRAGSASFNSFKKSIPLPSGKLMSRSTNDTAPHKSCSRAVFKFRHDMTCLFSDFKARHRPWFNPVSSSITKICSIEFLQSFLDVRKNSRNIVAALLPFTIFYLRDYINQGSLEKNHWKRCRRDSGLFYDRRLAPKLYRLGSGYAGGYFGIRRFYLLSDSYLFQIYVFGIGANA